MSPPGSPSAWAVAALLAATIHQKSRFGLALRASRENEVAAKASGINVPLQRLIAFTLSGLFMGVGGVLQAHFLGSVAVTGFWISSTFIALAMLIIGGQRSLTGAVVGTIVVSALLEFLRQFESGLTIAGTTIQMPHGLRELVIALLMLVILIIRNAGITGGREIPWPFGRGRRRRRAPQPRPAPRRAALDKAGGDMAMTIEARNISVRFGGLPAISSVSFVMRPRRGVRPDRPERRRQDHDGQRADRLSEAERRLGRAWRQRRHRAGPRTCSGGRAWPAPSRPCACSAT